LILPRERKRERDTPEYCKLQTAIDYAEWEAGSFSYYLVIFTAIAPNSSIKRRVWQSLLLLLVSGFSGMGWQALAVVEIMGDLNIPFAIVLG